MNISPETAIAIFDTSARIPVISTLTGAYTLYQKFKHVPEEPVEGFHAHVLETSTYRSCMLLVPVLGNVLIYNLDTAHAKTIRTIEEVLASESPSLEEWSKLASALEKALEFMEENRDLTYPSSLKQVLSLKKAFYDKRIPLLTKEEKALDDLFNKRIHSLELFRTFPEMVEDDRWFALVDTLRKKLYKIEDDLYFTQKQKDLTSLQDEFYLLRKTFYKKELQGKSKQEIIEMLQEPSLIKTYSFIPYLHDAKELLDFFQKERPQADFSATPSPEVPLLFLERLLKLFKNSQDFHPLETVELEETYLALKALG
jgi:hypothetical protein